ncbi:MAG: hypothetical protein HY662_00495 [Chloroflexi bacterium]|nr:hypothetical protein [Chloroflexota bacterium]
MDILSIILAFLFLASLVIIGAVLVGLGARSIWAQAHIGNSTLLSGMGALTLRSLLVVIGLLLAVYGIWGTYRVIWGE